MQINSLIFWTPFSSIFEESPLRSLIESLSYDHEVHHETLQPRMYLCNLFFVLLIRVVMYQCTCFSESLRDAERQSSPSRKLKTELCIRISDLKNDRTWPEAAYVAGWITVNDCILNQSWTLLASACRSINCTMWVLYFRRRDFGDASVESGGGLGRDAGDGGSFRMLRWGHGFEAVWLGFSDLGFFC